ncbi:hypothetical protein EG328_003038 [Venturia inaequalis]|uniref:Uncharacterized protein n=1 Tax=Venturia inaequalis TaxID=5025 RepID=A0A8H3VE14_VENIN|nr:hypothetical protein EG328_003038 [Venturia inaequalis]
MRVYLIIDLLPPRVCRRPKVTTVVMVEQLESHGKHHLTTFISLPRELRQQILFYTFYDAHLADLNHNYEIGQSPVLETPNMSTWAHDLASTHPVISVDVQFVADKWNIITINGWKEFCHTKMVQSVMEACERVTKMFRLQDEEDERAYLSWECAVEAGTEEVSTGLDGWIAFVNGE